MSIVRRSHKRHGHVYQVRLRDPAGRVFNKTFRTKREAERWELEQHARRQAGAWIDPRGADVTLGEVARRWLDANPTKRESGWARDETIVRIHLQPALGGRALGVITSGDVQALVNRWVTAGLAARTVRRQFGVLRAVLNYALDAELIARSPCRHIRLPELAPLERRLPASDQLVTLAEALGRYAPMMWLGAVLGMRWGEVAGLRVGRLDLFRGQLTVAEQQTRGKGGVSVTGPPKTAAGRRTLSLPEPLKLVLAAHLERSGLTGADPIALIFTAPKGGPLHYSGWRRRVWLPAVHEAGLDGLRFHDLRRVSATALVAEGVDLKTAQTRLGHSDPRLTLAVYAKATTDADRRVADRLGVRLMPPTSTDVRPGVKYRYPHDTLTPVGRRQV